MTKRPIKIETEDVGIVISRKTSGYTNHSLVWIMERDEVIELRNKINEFLDDSAT